MDWPAALAARFLEGEDRDAAEALLLRMGQGGVSGAAAFLEACRLIGEGAGDHAALLAAMDGLGEVGDAGAVGLLVIRCFVSIRADYETRQDAQGARARLSAAADAVYDRAGTVFGAEVMVWLVRLVGAAVSAVSDIAATRAPLVRVETGLSLPSSLVAFDLYGDPSRGREIVIRNRVRTPLMLPVAFEAASP